LKIDIHILFIFCFSFAVGLKIKITIDKRTPFQFSSCDVDEALVKNVPIMSAGSVVESSRCGGVINDDFIASLLLSPTVKELDSPSALDKVRTYGQKHSIAFMSLHQPLHCKELNIQSACFVAQQLRIVKLRTYCESVDKCSHQFKTQTHLCELPKSVK